MIKMCFFDKSNSSRLLTLSNNFLIEQTVKTFPQQVSRKMGAFQEDMLYSEWKFECKSRSSIRSHFLTEVTLGYFPLKPILLDTFTLAF